MTKMLDREPRTSTTETTGLFLEFQSEPFPSPSGVGPGQFSAKVLRTTQHRRVLAGYLFLCSFLPNPRETVYEVRPNNIETRRKHARQRLTQGRIDVSQNSRYHKNTSR